MAVNSWSSAYGISFHFIGIFLGLYLIVKFQSLGEVSPTFRLQGPPRDGLGPNVSTEDSAQCIIVPELPVQPVDVEEKKNKQTKLNKRTTHSSTLGQFSTYGVFAGGLLFSLTNVPIPDDETLAKKPWHLKNFWRISSHLGHWIVNIFQGSMPPDLEPLAKDA